jgi:NTE family protein
MAQNKSTGQMALALQGGGSHGAFTWGVLHALLEDERIDWPQFVAISGASAGAVNAAVLSVGYAKGDAKSARRNAQQALADFWQDVSTTGNTNPFTPSKNDDVKPKLAIPLFDWWSDATKSYLQQFSPYQLNPLNVNPLRGLLDKHLPAKALARFRAANLWRLHLAATEVSSGQPVYFSGDNVTVDAVLASACLPMLFQAVEIEGKHYWDGGYSANPPLAPLLRDQRVDSILLVALSATVRDGLPQSAADITERERDISFATPLHAEQRMWQALSERLKHDGHDDAHTTLPSLEVITSARVLNPLGADSKTQTNSDFLQQLFKAGVKTAQHWLKNPPQI